MIIGGVLPHLLLFGGVRRYLELGNEFARRGHEFIIYTPSGERPAWMPFSGDVRPLDAVGDADHDVLVTGSPELVGHLERARARARIFYLQIEGVEGEERIVRSPAFRIMVNSSGLARRVRRRYGIEPIDGIGGVNPGTFHPVPRGEGDGVLRVMCYGRLDRPRKGTRLVAAALRSVARSRRPVELHLFDTLTTGDADPRAGFNPGVPCVYYLDLPQDRMAAMYGAADVFVSAERRAGWSNTAAEAAACGLVLVCTRSGTEDFAEDGVSALVLPVRHPFFIARALARLARDRALASRLGGEARRRILAFTWERLCDKMERAFAALG